MAANDDRAELARILRALFQHPQRRDIIASWDDDTGAMVRELYAMWQREHTRDVLAWPELRPDGGPWTGSWTGQG